MPSTTSLSDYEILREVGAGVYGTVYRARNKRTQEIVAIKRIPRSRLNSEKLVTNLRNEISILENAKHPNIVTLYGFTESPTDICMIMELCEGGEILALMKKKRIFSESLAQFYIAQLVSALGFLAQNNMIHRDLKPSNILLATRDERSLLKLADFGYARVLDEADLASTSCGTPLYMAPEVFGNKPYDNKADLWSLGCILYEMLLGHVPFNAQNQVQLFQLIQSTPRVVLPESAKNLSVECRELITGLLRRDPVCRYHLVQVQIHPFVRAGAAQVNAYFGGGGEVTSVVTSDSSSSSSPSLEDVAVAYPSRRSPPLPAAPSPKIERPRTTPFRQVSVGKNITDFAADLTHANREGNHVTHVAAQLSPPTMFDSVIHTGGAAGGKATTATSSDNEYVVIDKAHVDNLQLAEEITRGHVTKGYTVNPAAYTYTLTSTPYSYGSVTANKETFAATNPGATTSAAVPISVPSSSSSSAAGHSPPTAPSAAPLSSSPSSASAWWGTKPGAAIKNAISYSLEQQSRLLEGGAAAAAAAAAAGGTIGGGSSGGAGANSGPLSSSPPHHVAFMNASWTPPLLSATSSPQLGATTWPSTLSADARDQLLWVEKARICATAVGRLACDESHVPSSDDALALAYFGQAVFAVAFQRAREIWERSRGSPTVVPYLSSIVAALADAYGALMERAERLQSESGGALMTSAMMQTDRMFAVLWNEAKRIAYDGAIEERTMGHVSDGHVSAAVPLYKNALSLLDSVAVVTNYPLSAEQRRTAAVYADKIRARMEGLTNPRRDGSSINNNASTMHMSSFAQATA